MWKQLLELFTKLVTLTERTDKLEQLAKKQQEDLRNLTAFTQQLAFELQRTQDELKQSKEREAYERKIFQLEVENQLLKSARQLPPRSDDKKDEGE